MLIPTNMVVTNEWPTEALAPGTLGYYVNAGTCLSVDQVRQILIDNCTDQVRTAGANLKINYPDQGWKSSISMARRDVLANLGYNLIDTYPGGGIVIWGSYLGTKQGLGLHDLVIMANLMVDTIGLTSKVTYIETHRFTSEYQEVLHYLYRDYQAVRNITDFKVLRHNANQLDVCIKPHPNWMSDLPVLRINVGEPDYEEGTVDVWFHASRGLLEYLEVMTNLYPHLCSRYEYSYVLCDQPIGAL